VLRPGATAALLDFGVPPGPVPRAAWNLYVAAGLPLLGRAISPGWQEVGRFLGGSIRDFDARWPLPSLLTAFREAGFDEVAARRLSLGGCVVIWGRRAPSLATAPSGRAGSAGMPV
jgi:demethylmenaquinone methyltransferase/2-methoxy-6-polyprenyl-1,4-benzoquinol methylase